MTTPDPHPEQSLLATEGVDEGSAASTVEGADSGGASAGNLTGGRPSGPAGESDPAPPADMESGLSREAREERGTGQQLEAGEG